MCVGLASSVLFSGGGGVQSTLLRANRRLGSAVVIGLCRVLVPHCLCFLQPVLFSSVPFSYARSLVWRCIAVCSVLSVGSSVSCAWTCFWSGPALSEGGPNYRWSCVENAFPLLRKSALNLAEL